MADNDLPVSRFAIRLSSRNPEEIILSQLMADDLADRSVNLSAVIKGLLLSWYKERMATGELPPPQFNTMRLEPLTMPSNGSPARETREDPQDELVRRMAGASFDAFG